MAETINVLLKYLGEEKAAKDNALAMFQIEKDCKNEAYAFILYKGLLQEYQTFYNSLPPGTDAHKMAIGIMLGRAKL